MFADCVLCRAEQSFNDGIQTSVYSLREAVFDGSVFLAMQRCNRASVRQRGCTRSCKGKGQGRESPAG